MSEQATGGDAPEDHGDLEERKEASLEERKEASLEERKEASLEERKEALREAFRRGRGYYDPIWDDIIGLDIDYFEQYEKFSSVPWHHGALDRKTKELIAIALNASVTHMYLPGVRSHIKQALRFGATRQEIMEVFELVSVLGVHSLTVGLPIFIEELAAHEARAADGSASAGGEGSA